MSTRHGEGVARPFYHLNTTTDTTCPFSATFMRHCSVAFGRHSHRKQERVWTRSQNNVAFEAMDDDGNGGSLACSSVSWYTLTWSLTCFTAMIVTLDVTVGEISLEEFVSFHKLLFEASCGCIWACWAPEGVGRWVCDAPAAQGMSEQHFQRTCQHVAEVAMQPTASQ